MRFRGGVAAAVSKSQAKPLVRWAGRYGLGSVVSRVAARRGDAFGRLAHDTELRVDPFPFYAQLRSGGVVVPGRFSEQ